jgi:hypothetical protein
MKSRIHLIYVKFKEQQHPEFHMVIFHVLLLFIVYLVLWAVGAFKVEAKWNASMEPGLDPSAKEQKMFDFGDFHFQQR